MGSLPNNSVLKGESKIYDTRPLHRAFEEVATGAAIGKTALIYPADNGNRSLTYSELDKLTARLARHLVHLVTDKIPANHDGDYVIAVCMRPTERLVTALLAVLKSGCAYLPIDVSFPAARVEHILNEARPCLLVHDGDFMHDNGNTMVVDYYNAVEESKRLSTIPLDDNEMLKHKKDNLAIVLYTSGSTGIPKGVRLPHDVIQNRLQWQFEKFPYSNNETNCIFKTALTFVDSVSEIWGPLLNGRTIVVVPKEVTQDPERLIDVLEKYKIERLVLVPSLLRAMLLYLEMQKDASLLSHLRLWVCSGEPLPVALAEQFFSRFKNQDNVLCNFYGSTEVMGDVTCHVLDGSDKLKLYDKVPIGRPITNTAVHLLDESLKPVSAPAAEDTPAELWVSGANLAAGYVRGRDPEKFVDNPHATSPAHAKFYRTGDYALLRDGVLHYHGRTDSQIKVRGHRVDLAEVERTVQASKPIEKAVALCYHPGDADQALLAFVTLKHGWMLTELQLEHSLAKVLPQYMVPQVRIMAEIPLLVNGKVDRQTLLKTYENLNNNDDSSILLDVDYSGIPADEEKAARALLDTVAAVLGRGARAAISLSANFYEIGGNSLNSIVTITKLLDQGYSIKIGEFIQAQTLGEVLQILTKRKIMEDQTELDEFQSEKLEERHKHDVIQMVTSSFFQKADLEQWLMPDIHKEDYPNLIGLLWDDLLATNTSFVVRDSANRYVGVCLSFDCRDEPAVSVDSKLSIIFEFLEHLEMPILEKSFPMEKGKVLHNFMMGTNEELDARENIAVMQFMEEESIKIGREMKYEYIFTTNTSPLTQQLGIDVFGYETLLNYQVNQFVASDGSRPFGKAPNSQRAIVSVKKI